MKFIVSSQVLLKQLLFSGTHVWSSGMGKPKINKKLSESKERRI